MYIASGIVVLWCILKVSIINRIINHPVTDSRAKCFFQDSNHKLMLPWLFISGVKSICLTLLATLVGFLICSSLEEPRVACLEFFLTKAVEVCTYLLPFHSVYCNGSNNFYICSAFATYLWVRVLGTYNEMKRFDDLRNEKDFVDAAKMADLTSRRARSLIDETSMKKTTKFNYFELKDVPKILLDMVKHEDDLSQDSLLGPGMMVR